MEPQFLAITIVILLFSVILHEVMHGYIALKFGDHTAENAGRLTLNPLPHIDLIGTILLPALLLLLPALTGLKPGFVIGWAKPVPVNPLHFNNIRKGELFVSLAGILTNLGLAIICAILFRIAYGLQLDLFILRILMFAVNINLMLAIFNLLPIPPLDGSKVLLSQLPYDLAKAYERLEQYGFLIILALMYFGILPIILSLILTPLESLLLGVPFTF